MNTSSKTLLQILVEELPKRGGWPEVAAFATQDKDGQVFFSGSVAPVFGCAAWHDGDWCGCNFRTTEAIDYATAIITREQYEIALAAENDGWIDWAGGECPVEYGTVVDVRDRDGCVWKNQAIGKTNEVDNAFWMRGECGLADDEIIAYRLHQPQDANSRANDDRLLNDLAEREVGTRETIAQAEADLNEVIGQPQEDLEQLTRLVVEDIHYSAPETTIGSAYKIAVSLIDAGYRKQ